MANSPTDRLVAESERLREWLSNMAGELRTFADELDHEVRELREGEHRDDPGERRTAE
jgi:hypothetical protein